MQCKSIFLISHYQVNLNKAPQTLTPLRNLKINLVGTDRHSEEHADPEEADHAPWGCVFAEPGLISCAQVATTRELYACTQEVFPGVTSLW